MTDPPMYNVASAVFWRSLAIVRSLPLPGCAFCQHCGGFESVHYLFFICRAYASSRGYLCDNLHEYSLKDLLYGTEHGTVHENKTLFLKIQDF